MWYSNLQTAFADGINMVIEFGGGIGTASEPEAKRPNLEGMIKKALRGTEYDVQYRSAINKQTLEGSVGSILGDQ
jgi:[acyl-carrier-protein] S-malonyltransferase